MTITVQEDGSVSIDHFKDLLDISKVVFYTVKERDGILIVNFYDKNKRKIKFYGQEKSKKSKKVKK